jgi:cyanophycinase-like exopeptidase
MEKRYSDNKKVLERKKSFRLLGSLPMMAFDDVFHRSARVKRMNRYLENQSKRIGKMIQEKELSKACII